MQPRGESTSQRLAEHEDGKTLGPQGHHSASEFTEWQLACLSIPTPASWLGAAAAAATKSLQSWLTLCDPIDGSPPGSSLRGILQARVLEWAVIAFSTWLGEKTIIISASFHGVFCSW